MASFTGQSIASSYEQLLHVDRDGGGNGTTLVDIKDGDNGTTFALKLATDKVHVNGSLGVGVEAPDRTVHIMTSDASLASADANASLVIEENDHTYIELLTPNDKQSGIIFSDGSIAGLINYNHSTNAMTFGTNDGATDVTISSAGNVGIGVAPEATQSGYKALQIGGNANITSYATQGAGGQVDYGHNFYFAASGQDKYISADEASQLRQGSGAFTFRSAASGSADAAITFTSIAKFDINSRISLSNNDSGTGGQDSTSANTILGYLAGANIGSEAHTNVLIGHKSGNAMIGGRENVAIGVGALDADQYGEYSIAIGASALGAQNDSSNSADDGMSNIGIGRLSGSNISNGQYNICIGESSGSTGTNNLTTGDKNVLVGRLSGSGSADAQNRIAIGHEAIGQTDNSVTLGNADVTDVYMSSDSQAYVHSQNSLNHVANSMSQPYYKFDGVNDAITVGNASSTIGKIYSASVFFYIPDDIVADTSGGNGALFTGSGQDDDMLWIGNLTSFSQEIILVGSSSNATYYQASSLSAGHHHIAISWDGTQYDIYLDGKQVSTINAGTPALLDSDDLIIGNGDDDSDGYGSFNGQIHAINLWNKSLTSTEIKQLYSGMAVPFKYKGANQTELLGGTWTNNTSTLAYETFSSSGNNITEFINTSQYGWASNALSSTLIIGKRYRLTYNMTLDSGTAPNFWVGTSASGAAQQISTTVTGSLQTAEFTATAAGTHLIQRNGIEASDGSVTSLSLVPIGAVAEYMGSSAGFTRWGDSSGNDLHGTVTGATLENTPYNDRTEYETGLFTPVLSDGSNNATSHASTKGIYTKTGNCVSFNMFVRITSKGSMSGALRVTGLPYTSGADEHFYAGITVGYGASLDLDNARETVTGFVEYGNSYLSLYIWDATTGTGNFTADDTTNTSQLMIRGQYWVSD